MDITEIEKQNRFTPQLKLFLIILTCLIVVLSGLFIAEIRSPDNFNSNSIVSIAIGSNLNSVSAELYNDHIIRSPFFFKIAAELMQGKGQIGAGDYFFSNPENILTVARRLIKNEQDLPIVKVTLPEGLTVSEMAPIIDSVLGATSSNPFSKISQFNKKEFLTLASTDEGYLFPDTYVFEPNDTADKVVTTMQNNFNKKISSLQTEINKFIAESAATGFTVTQNDIVIMASIIEKEATSTTDRQIISGILWKRLKNGQLLEVNPTLVYANLLSGQKITTARVLTTSELAGTSTYNTYKYKGLPPTPIDNPGLAALTAAVTPIDTNYWFYLNDSKGTMYYSVTYAEQLANQAKYLGN